MTNKMYTNKSWLYERYVVKKMTIEKIAAECTSNGTPVTSMTIYNHLKKNDLIKNSRNLGKRAFNSKTSKGKYY